MLNGQYITIFVDASYCADTGAGGWGCWVKYGEGAKLEHSARFKSSPSNALEAEMWAIANAIAFVVATLETSGKIISLSTDCQNAIHFLNDAVKRRGGKNSKYCTVAKKIHGIVPSDCRLSLKWVKAHKSVGGDNRNWVNNQVDKAARRHMKKMRKELNKTVDNLNLV